MPKIYYNSYLLDDEQLKDIDKLITQGLQHIELENKAYTDVLIGDKELILEVEEVMSY